MWNRLSPYMRAFLLPVFVIVILCAIMWVPAEAAETRIVSHLSIQPCYSGRLHVFTFVSGKQGIFDEAVIHSDTDAAFLYTQYLRKALDDGAEFSRITYECEEWEEQEEADSV